MMNDLWKGKNVNLDFTEPFLDDGYILTPDMIEQYKSSSNIIPPWGRILPSSSRLLKNVSLFDVTGYRVTWADISPADVEKMYGVFYVLSEHKATKRDLEALERLHQQKGASQTHLLSPFEGIFSERDSNYIYVDLEYMKKNAIARIVDGQIQTSRQRFSQNYQ